MQFIKQQLETKLAPKGSLIELLNKNLSKKYPERSHKTVHASDITKDDFCPRQIALMDTLGMERGPRYIDTAMKVTFDLGDAVSDLMRERWLADQTYGHWTCMRCGSQKRFCTKPTQTCINQKLCRWRYHEVQFVHATTDVSGSLDLIVDLGAPKLFVVECKTISPDEFEKLIAPKAEHRIRTNLYMKLVEESNSPYKGQINTSQAKVIYVSRAFGKKHDGYKGQILPFKEYDVARDDVATETPMAKAMAVKMFRSAQKMPSGVCTSTMDKRANSCPVAKQCFSGTYPACP